MTLSLHHTESERETAALAAGLAGGLAAGHLVCLSGDLGMGKSVFARALIRSVSGDPALTVPSPTYTLVQSYESPRGIIHHFDLYRLAAPEEALELGWEEALAEGITVVEWPEKLGALLPARRLDILFSQGGTGVDSRRIEVRDDR